MFEEAYAQIYKQYKIMARRPGEMAQICVYPFIALVSMGVYAWFMVSRGAPLDSMLFAFVGVNAWNFYELSQRGVTYGVVLEIWSDSMKHFLTGRFMLRDFVAGNSLFGLASATVSFVIISVIGIAAFGFSIFSAGAFLWADLFFLFLFATGVGMLMNALMLSKGEKYMSFMWMNTGLVMIFSGVYYPVSTLPSFLQPAAFALPPTYIIDSIRAAMLQNAGLAAGQMAIGGLLSLAYLAAGFAVFRFALKKSRESGMLTRY